ncbi:MULTISPECIES: hypothetical protein [unclassified Vibrio]|uniref:hypothetical protein n=1 Tax=unclassified Vibrio TaxID=2614977 RepID=UPI00354E0F15
MAGNQLLHISRTSNATGTHDSALIQKIAQLHSLTQKQLASLREEVNVADQIVGSGFISTALHSKALFTAELAL